MERFDAARWRILHVRRASSSASARNAIVAAAKRTRIDRLLATAGLPELNRIVMLAIAIAPCPADTRIGEAGARPRARGLGVIDGEVTLHESHTAGCERHDQSATRAGSQGSRAIVAFRIAASRHRNPADEGHGLGRRQARVVEQRNRQRSARRALLLVPKIQPRAGRHPQRARLIGSQLHRKTSAVDFAVGRDGGSFTALVHCTVFSSKKIIQTAIETGVRLRHIDHLDAARSLWSQQRAHTSVRRDLEVWLQGAESLSQLYWMVSLSAVMEFVRPGECLHLQAPTRLVANKGCGSVSDPFGGFTHAALPRICTGFGLLFVNDNA